MLHGEKTLTILVVDDEKIIADTLAIILNQSGFNAKAEYSGESAIAMAEYLKPEILISDVILGDMNGIETAIRICRLHHRCRVILISGSSITADLLQQAREAGHEFEILAKPVHPRELLERLREAPTGLPKA